MLDRPRISDGYLAQQRVLHENPDYGVASFHYALIVKQLIERMGIKSISDYGAGKCNLLRRLKELGASGFNYFPYDPVFSPNTAHPSRRSSCAASTCLSISKKLISMRCCST